MRIYIFTEVYYPDLTSSGYFITEIAEHFALTNDVSVITTGTVKDSKISVRCWHCHGYGKVPSTHFFVNQLYLNLLFVQYCYL